MRFFLVEPKGCFHAGDFVARRGAIASICRRPASLDLGLAFRWPISRARRQMRGDRIKCLGLRTDRTSCNTYLTLLSRWRFRWHGAPGRRGSFVTARRAKYPRRPRRVASERGRRRTVGHRRKGEAVQRPAPRRRGYFARRARSASRAEGGSPSVPPGRRRRAAFYGRLYAIISMKGRRSDNETGHDRTS